MRHATHTVKGQTTTALHPSATLPLAFNDTEYPVHQVGVYLIGVGQAQPSQAAEHFPKVVFIWLIAGYAFHVCS